MPANERGFTLVEMTIAVAILAMLVAAGALWARDLHPAGLRSALAQYDDAVAAARAIAETSGDGATLAFEPHARGDSFQLRVYRGRPNVSASPVPTSILAAGEGVALRERTLGTPPFAIFIGSAGHVSGIARYPQLDSTGSPVFAAIAREPSCPRGGFAFTFSTSTGAHVARTLPCAALAAGFIVPNPTPTPSSPLLTPSHLLFTWPGAPLQRVAATEWGYTHWFASPDGFVCTGGAVQFPNVLPAPFTMAWTPAEARAAPLPPPALPYSFPNSFGASMNDAPAFFPVLPHDAGLCRLDVIDAFGQHAGALAQVMGQLALQNSDGTPAQPVDLLLARRMPVVVYASKTYDAQVIVPGTSGCAGVLAATPSTGLAPGIAGSTPARTPIALRATGTGNCTLAVNSQYAGEPPALLGVRVRGALTVDPPAILLAPAGSALHLTGSTAPCFARAFTDATFSRPDTADSALVNASASGTVAYDAATGCYTDANKIASRVSEPGLSSSDRFVAASDACGTVAASNWSPPGPNAPAAWLSLTERSQARAGRCTLAIRDSLAQAQTAGLALRISAGCPNSGNSWTGPLDGQCYDLYALTVSSESTGAWTTIGIEGFYMPHGTPGATFLSWSVNDSGGCTLAVSGGTAFAQWGAILSNGDPKPPPIGAASVANGAGFTLAQTADALDAMAVAPPQPVLNGSTLSACHVFPAPRPPSAPN